ncbi:hypothetical protein HQ576_06345, partial [bacterium]|nr:hypothetical protein [bacterium]
YARLDALRVKVPRLLHDFAFAPLGEIIDRLGREDRLPCWALDGQSLEDVTDATTRDPDDDP